MAIAKKSEKWFGIPRDEIDWFPKIDYSKCVGCMTCVNFCKHGVYSEEGSKPKVVNPKNCIVGCSQCDNICPNGAIKHPSKDYLHSLTKRKEFGPCLCGDGE